jgi:hypothetical protein
VSGYGVVPDLSGVNFDNIDYGDPKAPAAQDPIEARFGNDMGWLDPALQQREITSADALQYGTSADPNAEGAQKQAINEMFGLYNQGGLTARDRAARAKNRAEAENLIQGQTSAAQQDLAERGMGGGGAEIAALLGAQQGAAGRLSGADLQTSADSEQRALDALMGGQQATAGLQNQQNQFVQNNASMMQQAANSNADWMRQGYANTQASRNQWDLQSLLSKIGVAQNQQNNARNDQQYGYGQGTDLAQGGANAFNAGQSNANTTPLAAFTGQTPGVQQATQARTGYTGGTQAAAGQSISGPIKMAADVVTSVYGGGGGSGGDKDKKK